jgi:hypothetical protein
MNSAVSHLTSDELNKQDNGENHRVAGNDVLERIIWQDTDGIRRDDSREESLAKTDGSNTRFTLTPAAVISSHR